MDKENREGPEGELVWDVILPAWCRMAGMCVSVVNIMKYKEYILQLKWQHWRESMFSGFWIISRKPSAEHNE